MSRLRRVLNLGWPTAFVAAACAGLAASNWTRPSAPLLAPALALCATAAIVATDTRRIALVGAVFVVAGLWWGGIRLDALDRSVLAGSLGKTGWARVVVTGPARRSQFAIRAAAQVTSFEGVELRERVLLELPAGRAPPQGAVLDLLARPVAPRGPETGFDERGWLARSGVHVVLRGGSGWREVGRRGGIGGIGDRLREEMARALASGTRGEQRAVLTGVVLGADEGLDDELKNAFRASGLYHLLAVSGQNVALISLGALFLGYLAGIPRLAGHVLALLAILAYALAVGWQPSVVRAAVAGCLASLAWLTSRSRDRWHFMALGALVLLAWTPAALFEPGFQLSFAAVAAIFVVAPFLHLFHEGYPLPWKLVELVGISAACGVVTAPILWLQFGQIPVWTVPANALAEPAMPTLLGCGLFAALLDPVLPSAAGALSWLGGWCAAWLAFCARLVASFPAAETSSPLVLVGAAAVGALAVVVRRLPPYRRRAAVIAAAAAACIVAIGWWSLRPVDRWTPPAGLRVTFLDVGQGDAALLEVPEGAVLVDQGPPEAHVAAQLRSMGIRSLSALVLTHPERDHVGGAADVLTKLHVAEVLDPDLAREGPERRKAVAVAQAKGVPIVPARAGAVHRLGRLRLRVLWPDGPGTPADNPNDHAIVLLASYGETDLLLTADAESNVTKRLPLRAVEVLKVAHHGSEDAGLAEELRVLRPRIAVVSVGRGNDYGHPRPETLAALGASPGLTLYRTDQNGRVVVESNGRTFTVRTQREVR